MKKPRKLKACREEWFESRRKELMQLYIRDRSGLLWGAWLKHQYEVYRGS